MTIDKSINSITQPFGLIFHNETKILHNFVDKTVATKYCFMHVDYNATLIVTL